MIFSKSVKVRDLNPLKYQPPTGINVNWKLYNKELYATFSGGNVNQDKYVRDRHDINEALAKLKVIQDSIKDYKTYKKVVPPGSQMTVWHDNGNRMVIDK